MPKWGEILARGLVRKTVALHPVWDQYVRHTQAIILQQGKDASYSLALNVMLLTGFFLVINQGIDEETREMMLSFLEDQKIIEDLNFEDLTIRYEEALRDRSLKDNR